MPIYKVTYGSPYQSATGVAGSTTVFVHANHVMHAIESVERDIRHASHVCNSDHVLCERVADYVVGGN